MAVFARYGFRRASMEEVASEAGLSRQGLYRHFAAKEALFLAVVEHLHQEAEAASREAAEAAAKAGADAAGIIAALIGAKLAYYTTSVVHSAHAAELMEESNRLGGALIQEGARAFREMTVRAIEAEQRKKRLRLKRGFTAGTLADLLLTATAGVKYAAPLPPPAELRKQVDALVAVIVAGASSGD